VTPRAKEERRIILNKEQGMIKEEERNWELGIWNWGRGAGFVSLGLFGFRAFQPSYSIFIYYLQANYKQATYLRYGLRYG